MIILLKYIITITIIFAKILQITIISARILQIKKEKMYIYRPYNNMFDEDLRFQNERIRSRDRMWRMENERELTEDEKLLMETKLNEYLKAFNENDEKKLLN